nr:hypothetical protein [Tanacetum cinerariifolium]
MTQLIAMCEIFCQSVQKKREEKRIEEEQTAKAQCWKLPACYDDDDDEESSNPLEDNIISELPSYSAVTPTEPVDSLKIIPMEIDPHSFNAESDLIESLPNHDSSVDAFAGELILLKSFPLEIDETDCHPEKEILIISSKIDSLFDAFAGELILLKSFPLEINETDCHLEKEIRLTKRLLYDNSSPRPPEEIVSDISNADIESFSPSPIPNEDSNSHMKEIDLYLNPDDPMPPGIEDDDDDSERDILILEELLDNYPLSLPDNESYHFDILSAYRSPAKPPDGNTGTLNIKMMGDVSDQKVPIPKLTITRVLN